MANDPISPTDFGASFKGFMEQMASQGPTEEPFFRKRLTEHFATDPSKLAIVGEKFTDAEHPNLHLAIEAFISAPGRTSELVGISGEVSGLNGVSLAQLMAPASAGLMGGKAATEGPVKYLKLELNDGKALACTQLGIYLVNDGGQPLALLVQSEGMWPYGLAVDVLAVTKGSAEACLAGLRRAMQKRNVYRGQVISLSGEEHSNIKVNFHRLPTVAREDIILPKGLLERIERQSIGFARHAEKLLAARRHLKRGMLLHGPPGTGKTFTAMYLAGRMPERSVLLITGRAVNLLSEAFAMARTLQPSTLILEDIDLIAEERAGRDQNRTPLLFELLNQMDGLSEDADILFVLTTNRPEILEPALKSRPGRIDLALEVPLPDAECRLRLFELYGRGLKISDSLEPFVPRTEGASAAFIRELFRRAALYAAEGAGELELRASHFDEALHEMLTDGGPLTRSLLGFRSS